MAVTGAFGSGNVNISATPSSVFRPLNKGKNVSVH